ncbi:MAG: TIGR00730 family Rossman fold protein [Candidatus Saccharimonadales bacterium]
MSHTHKHEKRVWLPDAHLVKAIQHSTDQLRSSDEEFERAFRILKKYPMRVTIFGSARLRPSDVHYKHAKELAKALSQEGYTIVSGGSGGIMEAANRGAFESGGSAVGFNIILPHEQKTNQYTTDNLSFHYFFTRKVMMTFYMHAYIYFPGGFGTFDELFEVMTLIQTKKMPSAPVILVGTEYWKKLDHFIREQMLGTGLISPGDEKIYTITDDIDTICRLINTDYDN